MGRKAVGKASCDVFVAGGGIAGISASLAAARNGAKTVLCEKSCTLGGLATLGLITIYLPLCDGCGNQMSFGIAEELLKLSMKHKIQAKEPTPWINGGTAEEKSKIRYQVQYNPWMFALEAEKLLISEGVEIIYDALVSDVSVQDGKITGAYLQTKAGELLVEAKSFVDATGDADLCFFSDAGVEYFEEGNTLSSWFYTVSQEEGMKLRSLGQPFRCSVGEKTYNIFEPKSVSDYVIASHEELLSELTKRENGEKCEEAASISFVPCYRRTRRICGRTVLDGKNEEYYKDSIGAVGDWRKRGPRYEIPFSCLYGEKIANLITAGRNISVTDDMWEITRVIPVCAVTGEAAGVAASMSDDFSSLDVEKLQKELVKRGVKLHITD